MNSSKKTPDCVYVLELGKDAPKVQHRIAEEITTIGNMLLDKNRKYGNSALEPQRIFSTSSTIEQLNVRIDDKLSRIESCQADEDEDVIGDLIGYLVLLQIATGASPPPDSPKRD